MAKQKTPPKKQERVPKIHSQTSANPKGHRFLVWLWIIGMIFGSLLIWGIAILASNIRPGVHGQNLIP